MPSTSTRDAYRVVLGLTSGEVSGVDVFSFHLARALLARGVEARLVMTRPAGSSRNPLVVPAEIPCDRLTTSRFSGWAGRWRALARHLERLSPCVYLPNYDYAYSGISPTLPSSVAVVGIVHSDDPVHYEHLARLGSSWNAVVCVSEGIGRVVLEQHPELAARIRVIPYGIPVPPEPTARMRRPDQLLRILYCGRLVQYQKRILDLAAVARSLVGLGVPFILRIVGDGDDRPRLEEACAREIADGHVQLVGTLPNEAVMAEMEAADAFLLTSDFEGLPLALLEAMSRGAVPVVSDLRSGIPELLEDGVNGFIISVGDVHGFAERLRQLQVSPDRRARMAVAAHGVVRARFRREQMVDRYLALFEEVLLQVRSGAFARRRGPPRPPSDLPSALGEHLPPVRKMVREWISRRLSRDGREPKTGR